MIWATVIAAAVLALACLKWHALILVVVPLLLAAGFVRGTLFSSLPSRALRENARIVAGLVESGGGTAIVVFHVPGVPVPDVDCTLRSQSNVPLVC